VSDSDSVGSPVTAARLVGAGEAFAVGAAAVGMAALAAWASFPPLDFAELSVEGISRLLGRAFFVALLLERALEVIVATWRGPEATALRARVSELDGAARELAKAGDTPASLLALQTETTRARQAFAVHRATTQRMALRTSFIIGLCLAGVGVRLLGPLLVSQPQGLQHSLFLGLDILLSGATFAGGIHKLTQAVVDFLESTSAKAKAAAPPA